MRSWYDLKGSDGSWEVANMNHRVVALLVYDHPYPLESLKRTLQDLSVEVCSVETCREAGNQIAQVQPDLIFTGTSFTDGTWADVVALAARAEWPTNVIVVGGKEDAKLYVSAITSGAYDFLLPPFEHQVLAHIVGSAELDVLSRRQTVARAVMA
jgi:DNA-binding NtrC family response regulator